MPPLFARMDIKDPYDRRAVTSFTHYNSILAHIVREYFRVDDGTYGKKAMRYRRKVAHNFFEFYGITFREPLSAHTHKTFSQQFKNAHIRYRQMQKFNELFAAHPDAVYQYKAAQDIINLDDSFTPGTRRSAHTWIRKNLIVHGGQVNEPAIRAYYENSLGARDTYTPLELFLIEAVNTINIADTFIGSQANSLLSSFMLNADNEKEVSSIVQQLCTSTLGVNFHNYFNTSMGEVAVSPTAPIKEKRLWYGDDNSCHLIAALRDGVPIELALKMLGVAGTKKDKSYQLSPRKMDSRYPATVANMEADFIRYFTDNYERIARTKVDNNAGTKQCRQ